MKLSLAVAMTLMSAVGWGSGEWKPITDDLLDEWENGLGYVFPVVEHFPVQELSEDGSIWEMRFGGVGQGFDSLDVYLIGMTGGTPLLLASGTYSGMYNFAKSWAFFDEITGLIEISFQMPGTATWYSADYSWDLDEDELLLVSSACGDPSWEAIAAVDSLLPIGEIEEARNALRGMFYPHHYYVAAEMYCRFLRAAHAKAMELYQNDDCATAADIFSHLLEIFRVPEWNGSGLTEESYEPTGLAEYMPLAEYNAIAEDYRTILKSLDD